MRHGSVIAKGVAQGMEFQNKSAVPEVVPLHLEYEDEETPEA
jgi:hypothetical protein